MPTTSSGCGSGIRLQRWPPCSGSGPRSTPCCSTCGTRSRPISPPSRPKCAMPSAASWGWFTITVGRNPICIDAYSGRRHAGIGCLPWLHVAEQMITMQAWRRHGGRPGARFGPFGNPIRAVWRRNVGRFARPNGIGGQVAGAQVFMQMCIFARPNAKYRYIQRMPAVSVTAGNGCSPAAPAALP